MIEKLRRERERTRGWLALLVCGFKVKVPR